MARSRRRGSIPVFPIAIGIIVVLGIVAIALSRGGQEAPPVTEVTSTVDITGDALPPFADGDDRAVGEPIPTVEGEDLDGGPMSIEADGPTAILFLAHWCPHCQDEVTELVSWLEDNDLPDDVQLVSVSTLVDSTRGNYPPQEWLEREDWPFPVLADDAASSVATAFGLSGTPFWVFVDESGEVVERRSGQLDPETLDELAGELAS